MNVNSVKSQSLKEPITSHKQVKNVVDSTINEAVLLFQKFEPKRN